MKKILSVDAEKCTGCRTCELVCSFHHENEFVPAKSRIHIIKWEETGLDIPIVCQQCDIPVCENVCPVKAIRRDNETGAMLVDYDTCIGCRMCIMACPLGALYPDKEKKRIIKCDLCDGDPMCVKFCPSSAVQYSTPAKAMLMKKRSAAEKISEFVRLNINTQA